MEATTVQRRRGWWIHTTKPLKTTGLAGTLWVDWGERVYRFRLHCQPEMCAESEHRLEQMLSTLQIIAVDWQRAPGPPVSPNNNTPGKVVVAPSSSHVVTYNRNAAYTYASTYWFTKTNDDGYYLTSGGYDADGAHFVNRAVYTGGRPIPGLWDAAAINIAALRDWLVGDGWTITPAAQAMVGDVAIMGPFDNPCWSGLVVVTGTNPTLATHSAELWTLASTMYCYDNSNPTYVKTYLHANTEVITSHVYLPVILRDYPPQPIKAKSGIHLGNRPLADWNVSTGGSYDFLFRLRGNTTDGIWPGAVVVQSQQVYTIERSTDGQCPIVRAQVRSPFVYEFLKEAARRRTRVIIRISPSPGNFEDAMETTPPHRIIADSGVTPHGQPYCYDPIPGDNKYTAADYFRSVDDVAAEMSAIHTLNASFKIPDFEFGFSPANEPNNEWYPPGSKVAINTDIAWQDMDAYFTALYDYVHQYYPGIRVFTPPMAQGNYAETMRIGAGCVPMTVTVNGQSGYTFMTNTLTTKNDGYTWHNYWHVGKEMWQDCPTGEHIFRYFPDWLRTQIRNSSKPRFILEADLLSPCQDPGVTLSNKDVDITTVASSLRQFITEELRADYIIVWLLTESPHFEEVCVAGQTEIQWHEAYREDGTERPWFANWWLETETWP